MLIDNRLGQYADDAMRTNGKINKRKKLNKYLSIGEAHDYLSDKERIRESKRAPLNVTLLKYIEFSNLNLRN